MSVCSACTGWRCGGVAFAAPAATPSPVWGSDDIAITDNVVEQAGDDAISAHANDADAVPVRAGMLITGNLITDSLGSISILGAKSAIVSGNILRRNWNSVTIAFSSHFSQGNTPDFAIAVTDNIIEDMIQTNALNPYEKRAVPYLLVTGVAESGGAGGGGPGPARFRQWPGDTAVWRRCGQPVCQWPGGPRR